MPDYPAAIAVEPSGTVLVGENYSVSPWTGMGRVEAYDATGQLIARFGRDPDDDSSYDAEGHPLDGDLRGIGGIAATSSGVDVADLPADAQEHPNADPDQIDRARVQVFRFDDTGPPAPGSLTDADLSGSITVDGRPVKRRACTVRLRQYPAPLHDCRGFVRGRVRWQAGCRGRGGVPSWGVALRYASAPSGSQAFYRPADFRGPSFQPSPPQRRKSDGHWLLPGGTDLGTSDPRRRPVIALGTTVSPGTGGPYAQSALIQPGVALRATLRVLCTYRLSDGTQDSWGADFDGDGVALAPRIVWRRPQDGSRSIRRGRVAHLPIIVVYDAGPMHLTVTVTATGAGAHRRYTSRRSRFSIVVRPRLAGRLRITASVGTIPAANRLTLHVF